MKLGKLIGLTLTHVLAAGIGFAAGIYALPILIAPDSPSAEELAMVAERAMFSGEFRRELEDSDALHWGEGQVSIGQDEISHSGRLSPGPDYRLYLSPEFIETEAAFEALKPEMALVGPVRTFDGFLVPVPPGVDPSDYTAVIVWCERFGEFITAAKYQ